MPYITVSTHGINGFYEDALLTNKVGRVILYAKQSSEAEIDVNSTDLKQGFKYIKEHSSERSNNFTPIAVTSLLDSVNIQTSLRWEQGGNLIDAFKLGVKDGMNAITSAAAELINTASKGIGDIKGLFGADTPEAYNARSRNMNLVLRKYRRKIISAANSYKNYGGSDTSISLPQLEFTFPAQDFCATHMQKCYNLLSYLLPVNVIKSEAQKEEDEKEMGQEESKNNQQEQAQESQDIKKATYYMYEMPPNNYVNPAMGFDSAYLEGTFGLDVNGVYIPDLVPTAVSMVASRARVLSKSDYENPNNMKYAMDDFYTNNLKNMKCENTSEGDNSRIPAVVSLFVQFEFAKHITIRDWHQMFFKHQGVTGYKDHGNTTRHDNLDNFTTGKECQFLHEGEADLKSYLYDPVPVKKS